MDNPESQTHTTTSLSDNCPICGNLRPVLEVNLLGIRRIKGRCKCEVEIYLRELEELKNRERIARVDKVFNAGNMGSRFTDCKLTGWQARKGTEKAYQMVCDFITNWDEHRQRGTGLLLYGEPGNGKTYLAAAVANEIRHREAPVVFVNVPDLLNRIRQTYDRRNGESEAGVLKAFWSADLIVLDDLGSQSATDWADAMIFSLIDNCYNRRIPVIVTTNHKPIKDDLGRRLDDEGRTLDRLAEMCVFVQNSGTSFRQQVARERIRRDLD